MDFGALLSSYGLPGIIIFALGVVVVYQNRRIERLIEARFNDQEINRQRDSEKMERLLTTINTFTTASQILFDKIKVVKGDE